AADLLRPDVVVRDVEAAGDVGGASRAERAQHAVAEQEAIRLREPARAGHAAEVLLRGGPLERRVAPPPREPHAEPARARVGDHQEAAPLEAEARGRRRRAE